MTSNENKNLVPSFCPLCMKTHIPSSSRLLGILFLILALCLIIGFTISSKETYEINYLPLPSYLQPKAEHSSLSSVDFPTREDLQFSPNISTSTSPTVSTLALSTTMFPAAETFNGLSRFYQQTRVNCSALFAGDPDSVKRAVGISKVLASKERGESVKEKKDAEMKARYNVSADKVRDYAKEFQKLDIKWYLNATKDCEGFKRMRGYITTPLTVEEADFPIAFSMVIFKDIEMVERLLRIIYRPQNRYCIHVDSKSDPQFFLVVQSLVHCFADNVVLSSRRVDVRWGTYTVLEPEIICMGDLWAMDEEADHARNGNKTNSAQVSTASSDTKRKKKKTEKWKYFINLTGQEFPLKTNYELVQIMKAFKGANNQEGTRKRANKNRWKTKAPLGILPTKGGVHTLLNRATVDYILHNKTAQVFLEWIKHQGVPDEGFFASLNFNPQLNIPGTYNGTDLEKKRSLVRYKTWYGYKCYSHQTIRSICILSTGDLQRLGEAPHLFANKFYLHQDRIVIGCLEEKIFNDTRDEFLGRKTFNTTFYAEQEFVLNRIKG
ncbi:beta-1,3-galactosyl-o-glycosyl-glycoprotein beta-1,6-n-acetylglucosaminyltransferase [Plakobranchus ocellatus]|uniref:Beta-1,3-galactosyl-o-glycosyl-glycoprotein beta-1,6-n-acetylglucosaminyltransferase n=1 Tax=Plakobranchus ocellatus TaxID=259542 RepID=A0AAV4CPA9_9GAST|nr:beta-1,3-galactosyl-o-glycosyl-glycoprotein beta-1,6-n-acetylglucosaminyltransferase [Plakobranchus ocellatus]